MRKDRKLQLCAGIGRFLEAVIGSLIVMVALVASALGQDSVAQNPAVQNLTIPAPIQRSAHSARRPFRAARLTYLIGNVVVEQANSKTQDVAVPNMPLVEGNALITGDDGQAEIEFEDGSLVRITPNSSINLVSLSVDSNGNYQTRVALLGGLIYTELRSGTKYQYSIDAGGDIVAPVENSTVRINFDELPAQIAVLQGSVHVTSLNGPSTIDADAGQTARSDAEQQGAPFVVKEEIAAETWDQWNEDRDQVASGEAGTLTAARDPYAGDQGYGWSDLDANGSWYNVPGQGEVWQPDAASDDAAESGASTGQDAEYDQGSAFDPYGYGSWVWTPAGYTWASGYDWGWLPYRCGQWAYFNGFGWGWQPAVSCGTFGFGGLGYGGYGYGVNTGRAPGSWRRPKHPIPGPGPVHPIIHGPVFGPGSHAPIMVAGSYGEGRLERVKTVGGRSIEPLPPIAHTTALRGGAAIGAALKRDYPVSAATHEAALGIAPIHTAPAPPVIGRSSMQEGRTYAPSDRQPPVGRSTMVRAWPNYANQNRSAPSPAARPQAAPAARPSSPPSGPASHPAPAASAASSPHK